MSWKILVIADEPAWGRSWQQALAPEYDFQCFDDPVAGKVTIVAVEPDSMGGFAGLEARTIAALADHIVREMASY